MNKRVKTVAVAVLLLGMASLMGSCEKEGIVKNVSPNTKVITVGETATVSCTFDQGEYVNWTRENKNVFFDCPNRNQDDKTIIGVKEGHCKIIATGYNKSADTCDVEVKTYISKELIELHVGDTASIGTRSGYILESNVSEISSFCDLFPNSSYEIVKNCGENTNSSDVINIYNININTVTIATNVVIDPVDGSVSYDIVSSPVSISLSGDETVIWKTNDVLYAKQIGETTLRYSYKEKDESVVATEVVVRVLP